MKNNYLSLIIIIILTNFICFKANSFEQFNFDITEIEIIKNGNVIKGSKRGVVTSSHGMEIEANSFYYDKLTNILQATGDVKIFDKKNHLEIYADKVTYLRNIEKIFTKKNSKAIYKKNIFIEANDFEYDKSTNVLNAVEKVKVLDKIKNYNIKADKITYYRNTEKIISEGLTNFSINSKYNINSKNVFFNRSKQILKSDHKTTVKDNNSNVYILDKLNYQLDNEILKGENIIIITSNNKPNSDKYFFSSAIINLRLDSISAKDPKVFFHKNIFRNDENDPRIAGVSSTKEGDVTIINKGIFTSCKKNDKCPPWSIKADKITHDKKKRQLEYKNAILKVYDFPILYLPKFFHPDPSVKRQSGLLKPQINNSNILGDSINIPYFKVISDNKDITLSPTIFENNLIMIENEYRQKNKNSDLFLNFGYVNKYKSSTNSKNKNIFSVFTEFNYDLNLENYLSSDLSINIERVTNDTYLKVFDQNMQESEIKPKDPNNLTNNVNLSLIKENYSFETGFNIYENLQKQNSDRYQYVLPFYNLEKNFNKEYLSGNLNFFSTGKNNLIDTNNLESTIINDLNYSGFDIITKNGLKNKFEINFKNLNSVGKNSIQYKSSPQIEMMSMYSLDSSFPLVNRQENYDSYFTPKLSLKINPHDMKDYSSSDKTINTKNIFSNNRLGLSDSLESGKSITLGIDFKRESKKNFNNFLELSMATVLRDKEEKFIPSNTSLNKKNSNLFGNIKTQFSELINFEYNYVIDNNYEEFIYNEFNTTLKKGNLEAEFSFIKERGNLGDDNIFQNNTTYKVNENNFLSFKTRRNRKLNLTEYYNLVYEYKNDCLKAGIKYNKTYYEDKDLKPSENLFLSLTLIPLGEHENKINN
tara:strand:+ start:3542 stop:6157 length:2616 start_codon:yes stop_codon:yes gene_type:complete